MSVIQLTFQQLLMTALKRAGVAASGQPVSGEDLNDAQTELRLMLGEWSTGRFYSPALTEFAFISTGQSYYTIGPGGTILAQERPSRIYSCFVRLLTNPGVSPTLGDFNTDFNNDFNVGGGPQFVAPGSLNPSDYPLDIVKGKEQWDTIANKFAVSLPSHVFYDGAFPLGNLFLWPIPLPNVYEIHVSFPVFLDTITAYSQQLSMPTVMYSAIIWNLAVRLASAWQMPEDPSTIKRAVATLRALKRSNNHMPDLKIPSSLVRPGVYNPYSDQVR